MDPVSREIPDRAERVQARIVMFTEVGLDGVKRYPFDLNGKARDGGESLELSLGLLAKELRGVSRSCDGGWVDTFAILRCPDDLIPNDKCPDIFADILSLEEFARLVNFIEGFRRNQVRPKKKKKKG